MPEFRSRPPASLYVAGPFAMGYTEFYNFLIPLYGLSLGMSAGEVGMLVAHAHCCRCFCRFMSAC